MPLQHTILAAEDSIINAKLILLVFARACAFRVLPKVVLLS
jgi:hypothetical protein